MITVPRQRFCYCFGFFADALPVAQVKTTTTSSGINGELMGSVPASQSAIITTDATSNAPVTNDQTVTSNKSATADEPATNEKMTTSERPATSEKPVTSEKPATSDKPVTIDLPATSEKPVTTFSCDGRVNGGLYPDPYDCSM